MSQIFQTHMFWAYGGFSNVEKICAKSFLKNGYQLNIWTYGDISNAPSGAMLRDAREILPEALFFLLPSGSCAPFSDYFRYAVLNKLGGLWVDTDIIALRPPKEILREPFLVTERHPVGRVKKLIKETLLGRASSGAVSNNVIFNPLPSAGNIIDLAFHYSERFPKEKIRWGELGPNLLCALEKIYPDHGFKVMASEFANPFYYWACPQVLFKTGVQLPPETAFVHLYNETWRNAKVDKNLPFPRGSLMSFFAERYL